MRNGIDFRRQDCYFSASKKRLIQNKGLNGYAILQLLLDKIYYEEGYYLKWDGQALDDFAYDMKMSSSKVADIVEYALSLGIFDKQKFKECGVLTSEEIQKNYKIATYKRVNQWHNEKVCYDFLVQSSKMDSGNNKTDDGNSKNDSEQEREKSRVELESKVIKKREEKEKKLDASLLSQLNNLSQSLNKQLNDRGLSKVEWDKIDFALLEKSVKESEFLSTAKNITINWLLAHYDSVVSGAYKDFEKASKNKNPKLIKTRNYTKEELDSAFSPLDELW